MSEGDAIAAALEARLEVIEREIDRLTRLAASEKDAARQQQYWELARDTQAEARKLRDELSRRVPGPLKPARRLLAGLFKALAPRRRPA